MSVKFVKMHGAGNDYIYFNCLETPLENPADLAPALSDRHFGIGGDGIVCILPSGTADFRMRMYNADGSEAEMCGNAIRCVGKFLYDNGYVTGDSVRIETGAGILTLRLFTENDRVTRVRVDMGEPILDGLAIPTTLDINPVLDQPLPETPYRITAVSMGNPHCVIFVDEITDSQVLEEGPALECSSLFPNRINVEFVKVMGRNRVQTRVWERGSGETLACGTGACAVVVACVLNSLTDRKVTVELLGGSLEIEWAEDGHVYMTGPAATVFTGEIEI
jgi:diaminopimelate epimerase